MDNWMPEIGGDHGIDNSVDNYIEGRRSLWGGGHVADLVTGETLLVLGAYSMWMLRTNI